MKSNIYDVLIYTILALSIVIFILRTITKDKYAGKGLLVFKYALFVLLCSLQFYYFLVLKADIWFCYPSEVGWLCAIINFILYAGILMNQFRFFTEILCDLQYNSRHCVDYRIGFYSIGIAIVSFFIGYFFFRDCTFIVLILLGIAQIVQIIIIFVQNAYNWGYSIASVMIYLIGIISISITLANFIPILIVALLGWFTLYVLGNLIPVCSKCTSCCSCGECQN